ncbi:MAG: OmpA family protein, partial [Bacteroidales bacterium]|nr:OmpA family protein [Bacteroidales bacterium]
WGPDYNQIFLTNNLNDYKIQPDEKIPFEFSFFGKNRGATNAVFLIYLHNQPEPLKINVAGNVYAPYKITVKCNVTNSLDNSPISTTVSYYNSDNQVFIATTNTNSSGEFSVNLPNELSYKFVAYGVNQDSAFVDLSDVFVDTVITVNLSVLQIQNGMKYSLQNSNFDVASSNLNSGTKHELDKLVDLMKKYPAIKILVEGHTDNEGSVDYNLDLSNRRANSVKNYLTSKGVDSNRITTKGYGATKPISTNNTDDGKAKNRRIEITINTI